MVLQGGRPWSSFVLVLASGKASFDVVSESRIYVCGGPDTDKYSYFTTTVVFNFQGVKTKMVIDGVI